MPSDGEHAGLTVSDVRTIARERLLPLASAAPAGRVNRALVRELAATGLLPRLFPARLGGTNESSISATTLCVLREGLALEWTTASTALALQGGGSYVLVRAGRDDVVERWVPRVASGEAVAAVALTEPGVGSDAAALSMRAERDLDGWRLSGEKTWIMNAPDADIYTVFARTTSDVGAYGITAFAVPGDAAGLTGEPIESLWPDAVGRLFFDGVSVPDDHVLGEVDAGFRDAMGIFDLFRPSVGAYAVGMAQSALDLAVEYAQSREAFGQPIANFQAVSHRLAEMAMRLQAARLLVYDAAAAFDEPRPDVKRRSAMAKLYATEAAQYVIDAAVQIHGAAALERGHRLEHLYREVRAARIYEGTSEIQRTIIARELLRDA